MKKQLFYFLVFTFSAFVFSSCNPPKTEEKKVINIACNLPLTGDLSTYGEAVHNGTILALTDLRKKLENDSIILSFDFKDNQGLPKLAQNILQQQLLKKPDIYVSGVQPQTMSIIDQISKKDIPHFVWVYSPFICEEYSNTFRTWLNFKEEAKHYIQFVKNKNPKKILIIFVNLTITNTEFNDIIVPKLKDLGYNDFFIESYSIEKTDFKDLAAKAKDYSPDVMLINGFKGQMINIIKSFRSYSLIDSSNTMCSFDLLDAAEELSPEQLDGLRVTAPYYVYSKSDTLVKWKHNYTNMFKKQPLYTDAYAYDMTLAIYQAAKRAQNSNQLATELLAVDTIGITGKIKFDRFGDLQLTLKTCYFEDGELLILQ